TPNLDRLAGEGARFESMYSSCPVCTPSRAVILTGHCLESNRIYDNYDASKEDSADWPTFDQVLVRNGYTAEYYGKWHIPFRYATDYSNPVRWVNGKKPALCKADMSEADAFHKYLDEHVPRRPLNPGEHYADTYIRPYVPDPLDGRFGHTPEEIAKLKREGKGKGALRIAQSDAYGCVDVPVDCTKVAVTAQQGLEALQRLKDGPFSLTISIGPPHPPMVVAKPYYGMFPAESIPVPASINDPRTNSPYPDRNAGKPNPYRDGKMVQQMASDYYGLVAEVDSWVGQILKQLDDYGLTANTLVVFTSDHGEMLGDHGMHSKFVFYEGSVHIPLILRLPGVIPAGTVVKTPVSQIDIHPTILDYCGVTGGPVEGRSLRPLVEGKDNGAGWFVVSEWAKESNPGFMVFDGRWKLVLGRDATVRSLDALYDLRNDPLEMINLIGNNPDREKHRSEAERMKALLVGWLERVKSPWLDSVKARPVIGAGGGAPAGSAPKAKAGKAKAPAPKGK
ncbi:MAG: sulfatase-like hydrolase/transferase, partial [Candidatus Sumerlaeota bacterium]|nr:sulfatase-like hydrolase/transferase [Candidatus Sumerlaeota bacterium]